jgi:transcriptional regulator with PAS, ATPase and Fis domain
MKSVCAWCEKELDTTDSKGGDDTQVSHGICRSCLEALLVKSHRPVKNYLDRIDAPVLLVDSEGVILTANRKARKLPGKKTCDIIGRKSDDVLECAYARLPGGSGKTLHCKACDIRRSVLYTYESGKNLHRVPVYENTPKEGESAEMFYRVNTVKQGDAVLLRIDEACPHPVKTS